MNNILLVDDNDNVIGTASKESCHADGKLHRAFSIFVYCPKMAQFLLQKRAKDKYHSGGLWANSCCSHSANTDELANTMRNRLEDELGIRIGQSEINYATTPNEALFNYAGKFRYKVKLGNLWENEIDHVFVLIVDSTQLDISQFNLEEVESLKWETKESIVEQFAASPTSFAAWFYPAFKLAQKTIDRYSSTNV